MERVRIQENTFGRWVIVNAENEYLGWNGSRWVPIDLYRFPAAAVQVSNLATREEAIDYAHRFGFEVAA